MLNEATDQSIRKLTLSGHWGAMILTGSLLFVLREWRHGRGNVDIARRGFEAVLSGAVDAIGDFLDLQT